jgi:hypothetical protein
VDFVQQLANVGSRSTHRIGFLAAQLVELFFDPQPFGNQISGDLYGWWRRGGGKHGLGHLNFLLAQGGNG